MIVRRRSALVLFLAFVAGLCGGALLSLGASGLLGHLFLAGRPQVP